jgi:hypothetical protein
LRPTKFIFKVVDWDRYDLLYQKTRSIAGEETKWEKVGSLNYNSHASPGGAYYYAEILRKKPLFRNYILWNEFCKNLKQNFVIMTEDEFTSRYFIEILLDV